MVKTNVEKYVEYLHVELDTTQQQTKMSKFDTTCRMSLDSVVLGLLGVEYFSIRCLWA